MALQLLSNQEFHQMMSQLNIKVGDIVFIDTLLDSLETPLVVANFFIKSIVEYLGKEGTLVLSLAGHNHSLNEEFEASDRNSDVINNLIPFNDESVMLFSKSELANIVKVLYDSEISESNFYPYIATGKYAKLITSGQSFDFPNGSVSPLSKLYELRAKSLFIGHDIKSYMINQNIFDISYNATIAINGGVHDDTYASFFQKRLDKSIINDMMDTKDFKELFRYYELSDLSVFSVEVRDYIDFGRDAVEERDI